MTTVFSIQPSRLAHTTYQRPEIGMGSNCSLLFRHPLWPGWILDTPCLAPTKLFQRMSFCKFALRQPQSIVEHVQKGCVHLKRFAHEWHDGRFHTGGCWGRVSSTRDLRPG